ncbi:cytochrome-c peroxidase [Piscinibacter sakaiensis]|uniref:cytochrome-c peroxidase n=1 Tax=Piscinibacter sakaiensis TaxID=1547922 RepID=UPI003AACE925
MRIGSGLLWLAALFATPLAAQTVLDFNAGERASIASHGPWPPPVRRDPSNRVDGNPAAIRFGRLLFFDKQLSADGSLSCAGCHRPDRAFQDGRPTALGRSAGQRNTPTLLDVAQQRWFGWDGANDSLWAASLAPLLADSEMAGSVDRLAAVARRRPAWVAAYRQTFGKTMPADDKALAVDLAKALAAYQATLVSPRTPFDDFRDALLRGDTAVAGRYPLAAQRGLRLFVGDGRCNVCHAGPLFTNGEFADIGRPFFVSSGVDPGRFGGLRTLRASAMNRTGPYNDAGDVDPAALLTRQLVVEHRHFGEFRVPGLRQLAATAPYMHDGGLATIEDVVRHYDRIDLDRLHADGVQLLRPLNLDARQAADLAAFLRSLSR